MLSPIRLVIVQFNKGKLTLLGMLDMSAAFDCVDHIILVRRLNVSFGIDENALE